MLSAFVKTHYVNRSCRCVPLLKKHNSFFLHCYCLSLVIRKFIRVKVKSLKRKARIWRLMAVKWWLFRRRRGVMKSIFMIFISNDNFKLNGPNLKHRENLQLFSCYYLVSNTKCGNLRISPTQNLREINFPEKSMELSYLRCSSNLSQIWLRNCCKNIWTN